MFSHVMQAVDISDSDLSMVTELLTKVLVLASSGNEDGRLNLITEHVLQE